MFHQSFFFIYNITEDERTTCAFVMIQLSFKENTENTKMLKSSCLGTSVLLTSEPLSRIPLVSLALSDHIEQFFLLSGDITQQIDYM